MPRKHKITFATSAVNDLEEIRVFRRCRRVRRGTTQLMLPSRGYVLENGQIVLAGDSWSLLSKVCRGGGEQRAQCTVPGWSGIC
jgi:hypothetical protein